MQARYPISGAIVARFSDRGRQTVDESFSLQGATQIVTSCTFDFPTTLCDILNLSPKHLNDLSIDQSDSSNILI